MHEINIRDHCIIPFVSRFGITDIPRCSCRIIGSACEAIRGRAAGPGPPTHDRATFSFRVVSAGDAKSYFWSFRYMLTGKISSTVKEILHFQISWGAIVFFDAMSMKTNR